jgi:hypothetical protein
MKIFNCYEPNSFNWGNYCANCINKYNAGTEVIVIEIEDQVHDVNFWNSHLEKCDLCQKLCRVKSTTVPALS